MSTPESSEFASLALKEGRETTVRLAPHRHPASHGLYWLRAGFDLFRRDPWIWMVNYTLLAASQLALGVVPLGSLLSPLLALVLVGGLFLGCRDQDAGRTLTVVHLFAGFRKHTGRLVGLGLVAMLTGAVVVLVLAPVFLGIGMVDGGVNPWALLTALVVGIPLVMLFWLAPVLVVLNPRIGVVETLGLSFRGSLRNPAPLLVYVAALLPLSVIAAAPLFLGWLVLGPVTIGSTYAACKDIYPDADEA